MKNLIAICLLVVSMEALVQAAKVMEHRQATIVQTEQKDCIMMKDGKMVEIKNGKITRMTSDITFDNGRQVTTMGEVMERNGATSQMKEGDALDMNGKWLTNINDNKK